MPKVLIRIWVLFFCCAAWCIPVHGQPTASSLQLEKPEKFENKSLGYEKSDEKKFKVPRRFIQNTITHYNWYFNANNKLNEVLARAKATHKDDYNQLLSFYNYSLDDTEHDRRDLDSILYKTDAGIVLHDLRNDWADNMFMLMGQAYYLEKKFDSAYITFQYINYAFSPKEDGYDIPIGSNASDQGNALTVSTREKRTFVKKVFSRPPSRNASFLWQIRTYIAEGSSQAAASLIQTLKQDPAFPERLQPGLEEVQALWFYNQDMYDSAAFHLEKALPAAGNKEEMARWEYLIAQLYERAGHHDRARTFYERTIKHTLNPVMEIYARLNAIRQNRGDQNFVDQNIKALKKMGRRDLYMPYRDVIYYTAAQIELERDSIHNAIAFLTKAARYSTQSIDNTLRNKIFLQLADLCFRDQDYANAGRFYDSVNLSQPGIGNVDSINHIKTVLGTLVVQQQIIRRQDSLQRIAALPAAERESYVKKLVRKLRKLRGLKEEETGETAGNNAFANNNAPTDLFSSGDTKGSWYFDNASLKAKGYTEFKSKWGNRPNVDNWQLQSLVNKSAAGADNNPLQPNRAGMKPGAETAADSLTVEALLRTLPLTTQQLAISNDSIASALFTEGEVYLNELEDYPLTITTLEKFLTDYPSHEKRPRALFNLYYCYYKTGQEAKAGEIKKELDKDYPGSSYQKLLNNPGEPSKQDRVKTEMTNRYDSIYNLFIEGKFAEALAGKKTADSLYHSNYWNPQLLYIEAVYYIHERQDDSAKMVLRELMRVSGMPSPMANKASTLIDVLNRRKQIEDHLASLQITRPEEPQWDSSRFAQQKPVNLPGGRPDTAAAGQQPPASQQPAKPPAIVAQGNPPPSAKDTSRGLSPVVPGSTYFTLDTTATHYVALVFDKVAPVYVTEAGNAFNRYNKMTYYNKTIAITPVSLNDTLKMMLMGNFDNASEALRYMEKTSKVAGSEIVPWLPAGKYYFVIITDQNLAVLKNNPDLAAYKKFLRQSYPGRF